MATRLLEAGTSLETIAGILGHLSLESTELYTKVDIESFAGPRWTWRCSMSKRTPIATFHSALAPWIERFIAVKHACGYKYAVEGEAL